MIRPPVSFTIPRRMTDSASVPETTPALGQPRAGWPLASIVVPVGLAVACLAAYWPAMQGQFIWDDDYYVVNNTALRTFEGIQDIWLGILSPRTYPAPQYYPMTFTSLWLDYRFWGLNPVGYHVTNLVLHVLCAWTLWVVLRKLNLPGAAAAAFIFALHPVNVESVAWITERKNVLSGLFYLLSLLVYLRYCGLDAEAPPAVSPAAPAPVERAEPDDADAAAEPEPKDYELALPAEPWKLYALALLLFALALFSKTVTATLPAAILVIMWWKRGRIRLKEDVLPLAPFFAIGLALSVFTGWMERNVVGAIGADWDYTVVQRLLIAGQAVWFYLGKLFAPLGLSFMYEKWTVNAASGLAWLAVLGVLATLAAAATVTRFCRGPLTVLLLFGGTLLPALSFVNFLPMRYSLVANHFVYLPAIAVIAGACALATKALGRGGLGTAVGGVVCVVLGVLTFRHAVIYQGPETIWRDTIARSPGSWMAHNNLGELLLRKGELDEAQRLLNRTLELRPHHVEAPLNLGRIALKRGDRAAAERLFQRSIDNAMTAQRQDSAVAGRPILRRSFAQPMLDLAALKLETGDYPAAEALYRRAVDQDPLSAVALTGWGETLRLQGNVKDALELQYRANELDPDSAQVRINLGSALLSTGQLNEALYAWTTVLQQDPNNAQAANNIGLYFVTVGKWKDAADMFEMALRLDPDFELARRNLEAAKRRAATQPSTQPSTRPATRPAG